MAAVRTTSHRARFDTKPAELVWYRSTGLCVLRPLRRLCTIAVLSICATSPASVLHNDTT